MIGDDPLTRKIGKFEGSTKRIRNSVISRQSECNNDTQASKRHGHARTVARAIMDVALLLRTGTAHLYCIFYVRKKFAL